MKEFIFTNETLLEIVAIIKNRIKYIDYDFLIKVDLNLLNRIELQSWFDLAQIFLCKIIDINKNNIFIVFSIKKLNTASRFNNTNHSKKEKYGLDSNFFKLEKNNYTSFIYYYKEALEYSNLTSKKRILNLGINRGDEFVFIKELIGNEEYNKKTLYGIDYSKSIIDYNKEYFNNHHINFICHDINFIETLNIGLFDLIISIATLQVLNINLEKILLYMINNCLSTKGSIIIAFPNCRWLDTDMIYGAVMPLTKEQNMNRIFEQVTYCKKVFEANNFEVFINGKDYIFITANKK